MNHRRDSGHACFAGRRPALAFACVAVLGMAGVSCSTKHPVYEAWNTPPRATRVPDGVPYWLPRTTIDVNVTINKTASVAPAVWSNQMTTARRTAVADPEVLYDWIGRRVGWLAAAAEAASGPAKAKLEKQIKTLEDADASLRRGTNPDELEPDQRRAIEPGLWMLIEEAFAPEFEAYLGSAADHDSLTVREALNAAGVSLIEVLSARPDPSKPAGVKYTVKGATVGNGSEADPEHAYVVALNGGSALEARTLSLKLNEAGILTTGASKSDDLTADYVVKGLEVAARVAGSFFGIPGTVSFGDGGAFPLDTKIFSGPDEGETPLFDPQDNVLFPRVLTIQIELPHPHAVGAIGSEIQRLRAEREVLVGGMAGAKVAEGVAAADRRIKEIDKAIASETAKLVGSKKVDAVVIPFRVVPDARWKEETKIALLTYSDSGVRMAFPSEMAACLCSGAACNAGKPCKSNGTADPRLRFGKPTAVLGKVSSKPEEQRTLMLRIVRRSAVSRGIERWDPDERGHPVRGYYHRIPGEADVAVYEQKVVGGTSFAMTPTAHAQARVRIAQFGGVRSLPGMLRGKRGELNVTLDPITGRLLEVTVVRDMGANPTANLDALAKTAEGLAEDITAAREADAQLPLDQLKAEKEYLETYKAIQELREELELDDASDGADG